MTRKRIFLLIIVTIFTGVASFAQTYTIQFKTNSGGNIGGDTYLHANGSTPKCGENYSDAPNYQWRFIPVPNEPGWYNIQSVSNGGYLQSGNPSYTWFFGDIYDNKEVSLVSPNNNQNTKWRLINSSSSSVGSTGGGNRLFKLASKAGNGNTMMFRGTGAIEKSNPRTSLNYDINNGVVEILPTNREEMVRNSDMELITNYSPVSGSARTFPADPNFTSTGTGGGLPVWESTTHFPVGYTRSSNTAVKAVHSNYSSGNYEEDGYYFMRIGKGESLSLTLNQALAANTEIEFSYWARAYSPGTENNEKVGLSEASSGGTVFDSQDIAVHKMSPNQNDFSGWYYVRETFTPGTTIPAGAKVTITNTMTNSGALLDIDDFQVIVKTKQKRRFEYKNVGPQNVHSVTQVIYTLPGTYGQPEELYASSSGYSYYRWHKEEKESANIYAVDASGWWNEGEDGLFYVGSPNGTAVNGHHVRYIPPNGLNDWDFENKPWIITCDASNYLDYQMTSEVLKEPTLSWKTHFEIRPAWKIAYDINYALAQGSVYEYYELDAPAKARAGDAANGITLRLAPQYAVYNYWLSNGNTKETIIDTESQGSSFSWYAAGDGMGGMGSKITEGGIYSFKGDNGRYLQINTRTNKIAGTWEYFDVYVSDDDEVSELKKKVARFKVNYVSKSETGPDTPTSGDLLSSISNKVPVAKLDFDQLGNDPENPKGYSIYGMGAKQLNIPESSYGFVDPTHYANNSGVIGRGTHGNNMCGYYSEYSFPQAVNVEGITSGYEWSTDAPVYDRTYVTTNGEVLGNLMYIDAAEVPGIFATLDFEGDMCPGTELYFSAWIVNLNKISITDPNEESMVRPNLIFMLADYTDEENPSIIKRFYTGDIGYSADGATLWRQIAFRFTIPEMGTLSSGNRSYKLIIQNNGISTAGNDFGIDEITVYRSNPSIEASRESITYCEVDNIVESLDYSFTINVDKIPGIGTGGQSSRLYYRMIDGKGNNFTGADVYFNQDTYSEDEVDLFTYGSIDLNNLGAEGMSYTDGILKFTQSIPPAILNGSKEGTYQIYLAESPTSLKEPGCAGEASFTIVFDEMHFSAKVQGTEEITMPADVYACSNSTVDVTALPIDAITTASLTAKFDWYYGPVTDVEADEEELENAEWDPDLNYVGFNTIQFRFDAEGNFIEGETGGALYSLKSDLLAFRNLYFEENVTPSEINPGIPPSGWEGTPEEFSALLKRMQYYLDIKMIYLYNRTAPLHLKSLARYFLTTIPASTGSALIAGAEGGEITNVPICPIPRHTVIQAKTWVGDALFGQVNSQGETAMVYPDAYLFPESENGGGYVVRLPEKDSEGTDNREQFVVPLSYIDEVRMAQVELVEVDGQAVGVDGQSIELRGAHGTKVSDVYLGVISDTNPNKIDKTHTITATRKYNAEGGSSQPYLDVEPYDLYTAWSLDGGRSSESGIFESYPLVYNGYNYFNPDPYPGHGLLLEGTPYPIDTKITNNKIAIEIPAMGLPEQYLDSEGKFKVGSEYKFVLRCTSSSFEALESCEGNFFFTLKVVPETVYWTGTENPDWNNDKNWAGATTTGFAPTPFTNVVLPENLSSYPTLNDPDVSGALDNATPYIEYDYNFLPNGVSKIKFESGSELGNQFYLNYDKIGIDLNLKTMQWYALSAPLRDMYSGDYSFDRVNPIVEMKVFNIENPQTHINNMDWSESFRTTNERLTPGQGFNVSVGTVYYPDLQPSDNFSDLASDYEMDFIDDKTFNFPKSTLSYQFWNDATKAKLEGEIEYIEKGGRDFNNRFIYETTETENQVKVSKVPEGDVLVEIPVNRDEPKKSVVVGNPFMAHLNFNEFYKANKDIITPSYQIIDNLNGVISFIADSDSEGNLLNFASTGDLDLYSIPPMQAFMVTTKDGYQGSPTNLVITKNMNTTDPSSVLRSSDNTNEANTLHIFMNKGTYQAEALVRFEPTASDQYLIDEDSRRMSVSTSSFKSLDIFTIVDDVYLDINRMKQIPESIPLGILTKNKGMTTIRIKGVSSMPSAIKFTFEDKENQISIPMDSDDFEYTFNNEKGNQIGRFFITSRDYTSINEINSGMSIYKNQDDICISSDGGEELKEVYIYSTDGKTLLVRKNTKTSFLLISLPQNHSVVIVKVITEKNSIIKKVLN